MDEMFFNGWMQRLQSSLNTMFTVIAWRIFMYLNSGDWVGCCKGCLGDQRHITMVTIPNWHYG